MKVYPINEDQLSELGLLRGLAAIFSTISGALFGFGLNIVKDLQINTGAPADVVVRWQTISAGSLALAVLCGFVAIVFWYKGHTKLDAIKKRTKFNEA